MWSAAVLLGYAVLVGMLGALALTRAQWPQRAPRLGLAAWIAATTSLLAAVLLAAILMISPGPELHTDVTGLLAAGQSALAGDFTALMPALWCVAVITLSSLLLLAAAAGTVTSMRQASRLRREHMRELALIGRPDPETGTIIIDHPSAAAYCLGGPQRAVVITQGAQQRLSKNELTAVLAHERAHLQGHHHVFMSIVRGLRRFLPMVPLFRAAPVQVGRLLEMCADDRAAATVGSRTVATAMLTMAEAGRVPAAALGASSADALSRIQRLVLPGEPLTAVDRGGIVASIIAVLAAPPAIAALFALTALGMSACGPAGPGV